MKRKYTTLLLVIVLMTAVVFGFCGLGMSNHLEHSKCPTILFVGGGCSEYMSIISMIKHHLSGVQSLYEGVVTTFALSLFVVIASVFCSFIFSKLFVRQYCYFKSKILSMFRQRKKDVVHLNLIFIRWLSLRNKQDIYRYIGVTNI